MRLDATKLRQIETFLRHFKTAQCDIYKIIFYINEKFLYLKMYIIFKTLLYFLCQKKYWS